MVLRVENDRRVDSGGMSEVCMLDCCDGNEERNIISSLGSQEIFVLTDNIGKNMV